MRNISRLAEDVSAKDSALQGYLVSLFVVSTLIKSLLNYVLLNLFPTDYCQSLEQTVWLFLLFFWATERI